MRILAPHVQMLIERSSTYPVEYAIVLLARREGVWHTVRTFDNAHVPGEHHEHAYVGAVKQEPRITFGPVNEAMHAAEAKLEAEWADIIAEWEQTR